MPLDGTPDLFFTRKDQPHLREVILRARRYIADPDTWTRGTFARDCNGEPVRDVTDPRAQAFCAEGALQKAALDLVGAAGGYRRLAYEASAALGAFALAGVNDGEGRLAVLAHIDRWLAKNTGAGRMSPYAY